ncbi:hypothetical protein CVT26_006013 [Gymnopilus dilepis]|uniref:Uncharacterized protein n=1 Tax=Gymnopilus dilepis TaxID=231916 RepID=A0A409Y1C4_9AGAR|nr:hypothetical protein CVT26_006013 [Gymnopilus dilepis]
MSSTLIVPAGASAPSASLQTTSASGNGSGSGNSLQQKGANYFFGFLIAFVVLLLVFVACGITSRRRFLSRRGPTFIGAIDPWGTSAGRPQTEPVFYERFIGDPAQAGDRWRYTTPLSASLVRGPEEPPIEGAIMETVPLHPDIEAPAALEHTTPPERAANRRSLFSSFIPSWLSRRSEARRHSTPSLDEKAELIEPPESLEVAVVIAMPTRPDLVSSSSSAHPDAIPPSTNRPLSQSQPDPSLFSADNTTINEKQPVPLSPSPPQPSYLPEYQIGVTTLAWRTELNSSSMPP